MIGGGVIGAAAALALARGNIGRRPLRVRLLEAFEPAHGGGSSHGDGRIVRYTYAEPEYLHLARLAVPAWKSISRHAGVELLVPTGSWECGPADSPALGEIARGLDSMDLGFERLGAAASQRRFPQLALPPGSEAIYQADGSVIRADLAVRATWSLAEQAGVEMSRGHRVLELEPGDDFVRLRGRCSGPDGADGGSFAVEAAAVLIAAGGWSGALLGQLGCELPLDVRRETVAYFPPRQGAPDHRAGVLPAVIDYHSDPPFYALPQLRVPAVKAGWHHSGRPADPDAPREADDVEPIQAWTAQRIPGLETKPLRVDTCLYTNTPDYHFVIDHLAEAPGVLVAAGFSGHGFKFAPAVGELAADLICGLTPAVETDLFAIDRFRGPRPIRRRFLA